MRSARPSQTPSRGLPLNSSDVRVHICCANCEIQIGINENRWIRLTSSYAVAKHPGTAFQTLFAREENVIPAGPESKVVDGCTVIEARCRSCDKTVGQKCVAPGGIDSEELVGCIFYKLSRVRLTNIMTREYIEPVFDSTDGLSQNARAKQTLSNVARVQNASSAPKDQQSWPMMNGRQDVEGARSMEIPIDPRLLPEADDSGIGIENHLSPMERLPRRPPRSYDYGGRPEPRGMQTILNRLSQQSQEMRRLSNSMNKLQSQMQRFSNSLDHLKKDKHGATKTDSALVKSLQSAVNVIKKGAGDGRSTERLQAENELLRKRLNTLSEAMSVALADQSQSTEATRLGGEVESSVHEPQEPVPQVSASKTSIPRSVISARSTAHNTSQEPEPCDGAQRNLGLVNGSRTGPPPSIAGIKRRLVDQQPREGPAKRSSSLRNEFRIEYDTAQQVDGGPEMGTPTDGDRTAGMHILQGDTLELAEQGSIAGHNTRSHEVAESVADSDELAAPDDSMANEQHHSWYFPRISQTLTNGVTDNLEKQEEGNNGPNALDLEGTLQRPPVRSVSLGSPRPSSRGSELRTGDTPMPDGPEEELQITHGPPDLVPAKATRPDDPSAHAEQRLNNTPNAEDKTITDDPVIAFDAPALQEVSEEAMVETVAQPEKNAAENEPAGSTVNMTTANPATAPQARTPPRKRGRPPAAKTITEIPGVPANADPAAAPDSGEADSQQAGPPSPRVTRSRKSGRGEKMADSLADSRAPSETRDTSPQIEKTSTRSSTRRLKPTSKAVAAAKNRQSLSRKGASEVPAQAQETPEVEESIIVPDDPASHLQSISNQNTPNKSIGSSKGLTNNGVHNSTLTDLSPGNQGLADESRVSTKENLDPVDHAPRRSGTGVHDGKGPGYKTTPAQQRPTMTADELDRLVRETMEREEMMDMH